MAINEQQAEAEIRKLMAADDPAALEHLYDWCGRELFGYLAGMTGTVHDAEELLNDLFVKIAEGGDKAASARNLKGYLYRMAANLAYDRCRERRRQARTLEDYAIIASGESGSVRTAEETWQLNRVMEELPPEQREVIIMKIYLKKTFEEIASDLGTALPTITSRYRYGIQKLKVRLEELE